MRIHCLLFVALITGLLLMGCQGIDIFSPGPVERGLCRYARAGGEDVAQWLEAQQSGRR
jgi:hypothetical protein